MTIDWAKSLPEGMVGVIFRCIYCDELSVRVCHKKGRHPSVCDECRGRGSRKWRAWSHEDRDVLADLSKRGCTTAHMARVLGRTINSIMAQKQKLGLCPKRTKHGPEAMNRVRLLLRENYSYAQIGNKMGLSRNQVAGLAARIKGRSQ